MVREALRPLHPLGALLHQRLARAGPVATPDPTRRVRQARAAVESGEVQSGRVARSGRNGGHEARLHHHQTPRRLLPLRVQTHGLPQREHALRQGRHQAARRRLPPARLPALPVLLHRRLAPPELSESRPAPQTPAAAWRPTRFDEVSRVPQGAGARTLHQLRRNPRLLVGHERGQTRGPVHQRHDSEAPAQGRHQ